MPKQITAEDGTSVNYTYFADGTKFKAVDATGNGFVYTGSLRWSVENGALVPESIAITGGRAVFADNSWATNYYITDHLGSVRAVTDAEGEVLGTYDYMPYGSEISSRSSTTTDYRFTGKERQSMVNNSIYDSFARFQNTYGRFMSIDPKAESFYHISPYTYCAGDPVNLVDPDGEASKIFITVYKYGKRLVKLYNKYGKITSKTLKEAGLSEFIDIASDLHTIFSGNTTFWDKTGALADIIIGSDFNNKGGREIAEALGLLRTQKHHIIPKAVYRNYPKLKDIINRDGAENLIDIPEVFHGNHPQFNDWIDKQLKALKDDITKEKVDAIMDEAQKHIHKAYDKFLIDGTNLNDYFLKINTQIP